MKKHLPAFEKGFTLIELMVVVTIMAFLSVIGIVAFSNAQAQARDGRRRADIDAIATAMEANRDPVAGTYKAWTDTSIYANQVIPYDPTQTSNSTSDTYKSNTYKYVMISGGVMVGTTAPTTFAVCALLENKNGSFGPSTATSPTAASGVAGCTPTIAATANDGWCYCRINQQ